MGDQLKPIVCFIIFISTLVAKADTYQLATQLNKPTGDFEYFIEGLNQPVYQDIESFLAYWKTQRPEFYESYVAAYRSRSLQQSTPDSPRVIMFNNNADFIMSFNGHSQHRGYQHIELIRFKHDEARFEFYELGFKNNKPYLSEANPRQCLECHQSYGRQGIDPRPNWEPYNAWLGFFGSLDDNTSLFRKSFVHDHLTTALDHFVVIELEQEAQWFDEFNNNIRPNHPRYRWLDSINNKDNREATINGDFTNRLAVLNMRRIARLAIQDQKHYEKIKWSLWAFTQCREENLMAQDVYQELLESTPFKELVEETSVPSSPCIDREEGRCIVPSPPSLPNQFKRISLLLNLLFEPFGISTEDWSMDFKTSGRFAAFERFGLTNDPRPPQRQAFREVLLLDPDFSGISCEQAKQRSLQEFSSLSEIRRYRSERASYNTLLSQQENPGLELLSRCVRCHVERGGADIPYIPFDDPIALRSALLKEGFKKGTLLEEIRYRTGPHAGIAEQMPPRGVPQGEGVVALINYLEGIIAR